MQAVARFPSTSKRVTIGISKEALRSNLVGRGKSYATSVKDESLKVRKAPKRIPKQERRSLIVSFVEKYRASNEGRFPTNSVVQKEVGGGYYIVREIVQELEYKHKLAQAGQSNPPQPIDLKKSSSATSSDSIGEKVPPTVSVAKKIIAKRSQRNTVFKAEGVKKEEHSGKSSDGISVEEQGHDIAPAKEEVPNVTSSYTTTKTVKTQPSLKVNKVKEASKVEMRTQTLQQSPEKVETSRTSDEVDESKEIKGKQNYNGRDESSTTEGSIWGNLKSFSDKIINLWKKL